MGKSAALDFGLARVGVAVADELGLLAHPRPHLDGSDPKALLRAVEELVAAEGVTLLLVGLPRNLRGTEGPAAKRCRQFAAALEKRLPCEVRLIDERWSTVEAQRRLHEQGMNTKESRSRIDSAAAAVLLQAHLDFAPGVKGA